MKKLIILTMCVLTCTAVSAQKFALVDMEYILKNVPAYERANEQLNQISKKWEAEVEAIVQEVEAMYKKYQSEVVFLSDAQKQKAEEAIMAREKAASELRKKYFSSEGELYKKRQSLMAPIQDEIYNAIKDIADQKGYQLVHDRASAGSIIYASPKIDISDEVLQRLGYSY
ncbi:MAG: OmpH family outer membrane protein [Bacteroidaceae bacterium]|nr:OmpH family outer membrane protein [Bacteroidaceae bacterium]MBQ8675721.1 OmpH family outer membrane protein [Bacteroidaceae bacterium]MBQ9175945.1 OmpH family outer membrane protein [Bacteroidaceae bacterium]MBR1378081.1 OmpH family outer membrane protein [Bacteroidaceae bacterium]